MIGERIRQARLAAGLTLDEVAQQLANARQPLTKAALSKYELNKSTPNAQVVTTLARVLSVAPSYFLADDSLAIRWLAFRKHATLTQTRQDEVKAFSMHVAEQQCELTALFYPDETPSFPTSIPAKSPDEAERAAIRLRSLWALDATPIESLTQLIEDHGGIVIGIERDIDHFDGLSGWVNETTPLTVSTANVSIDRRRFNIAHELGHLLLWHDDLDENTSETIAHRFAAALLLPAQVLRHELGDQRRSIQWAELGLLKQRYGISMQAIMYRARDLGIITASYHQHLCQEFARNGWRKSEPSQFQFQGNEEPLRLKQMTVRAFAEGIINRHRAEQLCPGCLEDLAGTERVEPTKHITAHDLMRMPLADRHAYLSAMAAEAADDYATDPELREFFALDGVDWPEEEGH